MADLVLSCLESRVEDNRNLYARFLVGPFLKGEALTVATALRRVLLSSIESIGITALYIQGITHEFSTIVGVRESVLELSLNFQAIVLSYDKTFFQKKSFFDTIQIGYLQVQGPKVIYANHLKLPLGVKLVDPTQYIATVSKEGSIVLKFIIGKRMPSLHQNTGPESHFGNQARELPIIGEVGKKSIERAKKTCFYKKASTIKEKTKSFFSPGRRMIFRSNDKMYAKLCNLKNKKKQFKKESFSLSATNKSSCVQSSALFAPFAYALTQKALCFPLISVAHPSAKQSFALVSVTENNGKHKALQEERYGHNGRSTRKHKPTDFIANKARISLGKLSLKQKNSFQRNRQYKILHCKPYNSQRLSFYKTKRRFLILSFFSRVCVPMHENELTNSSSLPKIKRIFRRRKDFFKKYKVEDKNNLKEKKFLFLSKNKIFKSNICLRNVIPLDFTLTPVLKVNFVIEIDDEVLYLRQKVRERIILEVWTNGSIHPRQALHDAALSLTDIFASFRSVYQGASYS